ncbi:CDP-diacylglycerol--glycerol-3-phosphate 3-phosphatidyltransferase [Candidatus Pantoea edessiphila]|uniref:CDP-diacylglycerol--glycerol-3-phosphate 3-phosphatidyltransferase n=1 Tax=Candidatus Pantoea edessiphila TaxID=2044610 RepID=A0A2P5T2E3_9GAMM|nr:CDP-diacylglycerol--glycerol-3-phosphate 3-phosphatidyltransferase [Candidatus Pantoea edessiphila]PPI88765.1 CDP-diacylglycerol--glycerol-3-phosphate 3-phosphatidyltransferase [Candidatus Pantoea edessiphila]
MQLNIPNALTLFRFILIPFFVVLFYIPCKYATIMSALVFFIASITDWFDGFLARRLKQTTEFGSFLDPIVDKVMVVMGLILVSEYFHVYWVSLPTMIIISREIIISAIRQWIPQINKIDFILVLWISKIKTTIQMFSLIALIWHPNIKIINIGIITLYIALILTLWSMFLYIKIFQYNLLKR